MATSQELLDQLILEASTLTQVFKTYRASLDASVNTAVTAFDTAVNAKMNTALNYIQTIQTVRQYYVDAVAGLDTNTGLTTTTAFKTITKALQFTAPGVMTRIALRIGQKHIVTNNGGDSYNSLVNPISGSIYVENFRLPTDPAIDLILVTSTNNDIYRYGTIAEIAELEKKLAVIQFEDSKDTYYNANNYKTIFPTLADAQAFMDLPAKPKSSASTSNLFFFGHKLPSVTGGVTILFRNVVLSMPRYDLMDDDYYTVLKPNPSTLFQSVDSFGTTVFTIANGYTFTNRGILLETRGTANVIVNTYGSTLFMDEKLSPKNKKPIRNSSPQYGITINTQGTILYKGSTLTYAANTDSGVAALVSTIMYPTSTIAASLTDTDHPARNITSPWSPCAKTTNAVATSLDARIFFPLN